MRIRPDPNPIQRNSSSDNLPALGWIQLFILTCTTPGAPEDESQSQADRVQTNVWETHLPGRSLSQL